MGRVVPTGAVGAVVIHVVVVGIACRFVVRVGHGGSMYDLMM